MSEGYLGNASGDPYRYGVYLRPDPKTCLAVTTVTAALRAQYGLISAGAFPPHATLVGTEHLGRDEDAIVAAVSAGLAGISSFEVHNRGVIGLGVGWVYDVHHRADGSVNQEFTELAAAVAEALTPLRRPAPLREAVEFRRETFHAHLSLASHDLIARADLHEEVKEYIDGLDLPVPDRFSGDTVVLYRTSSEDWTGRWWQTLRCEHLRTWRLSRTGGQE